jgi:hypothetical protein
MTNYIIKKDENDFINEITLKNMSYGEIYNDKRFVKFLKRFSKIENLTEDDYIKFAETYKLVNINQVNKGNNNIEWENNIRRCKITTVENLGAAYCARNKS